MAKTGYGNIVIKFRTPWRGSTHDWSVASSHSGSAFTNTSDMLQFLISVYDVIASYLASGGSTFCCEVAYYNGVDSAPKYSETFVNQAAATAAGFLTSPIGSSYMSAPGTPLATTMAPYEACCMLEAPIGLSKTGKPVTMKKFVHGCAAPTGENDGLPGVTSDWSNEAVKLGNGQLYETRVLISPKGAQGTWSALDYYGNHQAQRRRKKKTS